MLPGDLFSRDRLIRSYQNVSNLGFFQQPMPSPDVKPAANGVDVDIIFRVEEKRTGNINFGASLGQGTGVGGFLGSRGAEPVRPGQARQAAVAVRQEHQRLHAELHRSGHPGEPDLRHGLALRFPRRATPSATSAAASRPAAASSSASPSSARATPGSSPRTRTSACATPRAPRTSAPASAAAPAPAPRSAPASSATPGSACPSRPAARSPT